MHEEYALAKKRPVETSNQPNGVSTQCIVGTAEPGLVNRCDFPEIIWRCFTHFHIKSKSALDSAESDRGKNARLTRFGPFSTSGCARQWGSREQSSASAHPRRSHGRFRASVPAANDENVEVVGGVHAVMIAGGIAELQVSKFVAR